MGGWRGAFAGRDDSGRQERAEGRDLAFELGDAGDEQDEGLSVGLAGLGGMSSRAVFHARTLEEFSVSCEWSRG